MDKLEPCVCCGEEVLESQTKYIGLQIHCLPCYERATIYNVQLGESEMLENSLEREKIYVERLKNLQERHKSLFKHVFDRKVQFIRHFMIERANFIHTDIEEDVLDAVTAYDLIEKYFSGEEK